MFWLIVLFGATVMWVVHSVFLINSFAAADTTSQVIIESGTLDFPTVSLCNINPIVLKQVETHADDNIRAFLQQLQPKVAFSVDPDEVERNEQNQESSGRRRVRRQTANINILKL